MSTPPAVKNSDGKPKMKVGDGTPGPGRPKGLQNQLTRDVKAALWEGAQRAGAKLTGDKSAAAYFMHIAVERPEVFAPLIGKLIPAKVEGTGDDGAHTVELVVRREIIAPDTPNG